jgi:uncharacterized protein involved in exopolysaccharide biosynthesis
MESRVNPIGQSSTTSRAVVESIFRYKSRFVGTFAAVLGMVVLYTAFAPRHYQSEMNILVRNARPDYQITPERSNGTSTQPDVTEERINSEIEVLKSRDVADRVIDPTWNSSAEKDRTSQQIRSHEKAVEKFNKQLYIELLRKSNVIHVVYETRSAKAATDTVEKLLETFLAKQHELERSSGASTFFATEQERYKRELDAAQQQLATYQQDRQIVSLPEKEAALEQQIIELQQQLRSTDLQISELSQRLTSGQKELYSLTQRQTTQQKTIPNIYAMEQLTTMLATFRNQKTGLLTKFPPTDRMVQEVDQQIVNTTEALRAATETQPAEKSTDVNPVWQQVKAAVSQNTIDRSAAQARRRDIGAQLANLQATLARTEGSTVDFNTLQAKVTELQGNYQLYTQKRNEAQVANAMDAQQLVNVAIAERPTYSTTPSSPKIGMTLSMGTFAALFFAMCVVFFSEMGRGTIASPSELEAITTTPVLATVPFIEAEYLHFTSNVMPTKDSMPPPEPPPAPRRETAYPTSDTALALSLYTQKTNDTLSRIAPVSSQTRTHPMMILLP